MKVKSKLVGAKINAEWFGSLVVNQINKLLLLLTAIIFTSCASHSFIYTPPNKSIDVFTNKITINKDFDTTWNNLIEIVSQQFFGIKNYEKATGLLILEFNSTPEKFVDCGYGVVKKTSGYPAFINNDREGPYIKLASANLNGFVNIFVKQGNNKTIIEINTKYVITLDDGGKRIFNFSSRNTSGQTIRIGDTDITCIPTYEAEFSLIKAIEKL